jgi:hypothetical protein
MKGSIALLAVTVTLFAPVSEGEEFEELPGLLPITEAPSNSRSSPNLRARDSSAVDLRPEEPAPSDPKRKGNERPVDTNIDRLDPFFKPKAPPRAAETDPELEAPVPTQDDEVENDRIKRREREQQALEEIARTPRVNRDALLRASMIPRDIVDVPSGGITEGLTRLGEEGFLMGKSWSLNYGVFLSSVFDDNVNLSSTDKQSDIQMSGGASVSLRLGGEGSKFVLSGIYGINYGTYLSGTDDPVLGQNLALSALYRFTKLTLALNVGLNYGAGGTVDTGERTNRGTYFASLTANYTLSEKTSVNIGLSGANNGYQDLLSSNETRFTAFLNYNWTPKLRVGLGGSYGTTKAEGGSSQSTPQILVSGSYTATAKLSVSGSIGIELVQTDAGDNLTPVFGIGVAYQPFDRTTVTLDLGRSVFSSAVLAAQDYTATTIGLSVAQQLFPRLRLSLGVGYQISEYFGVEQGVEASRNDTYFSCRASVGWEVARWCQLGAFYEFSDSQSTGEGARPFSRNRVGLQVSLMF